MPYFSPIFGWIWQTPTRNFLLALIQMIKPAREFAFVRFHLLFIRGFKTLSFLRVIKGAVFGLNFNPIAVVLTQHICYANHTGFNIGLHNPTLTVVYRKRVELFVNFLLWI
jgi:hypothetical protein